MKQSFLFTILILPLLHLSAQETPAAQAMLGEYSTGLPNPIVWYIQKDGNRLMLRIPGQGSTELIPLQGNNYWPKMVNPRANIEFIKDSLGKIRQFRWTQKSSPNKWVRISAGNSPGYAGKYQLELNPYQVLYITDSAGLLKDSLPGQPAALLTPLGKETFLSKKIDHEFRITFDSDRKSLTTITNRPLDFIRVSDLPHVSGRTNGFTRADSLQGALTPLRTCYDVLFYDLNILVEPETKSIRGATGIRFKTIRTFDRMQIDLFANMNIEKILFHGRELSYTREYNAVFVQFPAPVKEGSEEEISVQYTGHPLEPDIDAGKGGWFWLWNRDRKIWIETVSQGIGASVWWPCKDHLSDRPDSMKISVTYPSGLMEISNGRLLSRTDLPGGLTRCDWYVSYPINNYDVVVNIGDYTHYSDSYIDEADTLALNYYCMSYNLPIAKNIFSHSKAMLSLYKKAFGPYPFPKDGFTLMESIYPMEHQGAISIGSINNPFNSTQYDSAELVRTMWHESAHEWWGNSVGCRDYADLWIHEAFATYAEVLNYESSGGRSAALKYLHSEMPKNKEPVIGVYDVNYFHLGDMYTKGALMLHTLRSVINNDSLWFNLLRGIQERFRYQTVTTEDVIGYFKAATGKDYTCFFDEYLRYTSIPALVIKKVERGGLLKVQYKWQTNRPGFCMPIKVTTFRGAFAFIYPGDDWQEIELKGMRSKDFKVDTDNFYIKILYL